MKKEYYCKCGGLPENNTPLQVEKQTEELKNVFKKNLLKLIEFSLDNDKVDFIKFEQGTLIVKIK